MSNTALTRIDPSPQSLPATLDKIEGRLALANSPEEINEVMALMDAAVAYAKRYYKDQQDVIQRAKSLRLQAERRLGEMLRVMPKSVGAAAGGVKDGPRGSYVEPRESTPTLADIGITKKTSMRAQQLAAMPAEKFAQVASGEISVAQAVAAPVKHKVGKPMTGPKADSIRQELKEASQRGTSMLVSYARLLLTAIQEQKEFSVQERDLLSQIASAINQL